MLDLGEGVSNQELRGVCGFAPNLEQFRLAEIEDLWVEVEAFDERSLVVVAWREFGKIIGLGSAGPFFGF